MAANILISLIEVEDWPKDWTGPLVLSLVRQDQTCCYSYQILPHKHATVIKDGATFTDHLKSNSRPLGRIRGAFDLVCWEYLLYLLQY